MDDLFTVVEEERAAAAAVADVELAMLRFAGQWWRDGSAKEHAIRARFGISPTRFHQVVNRLITTPAAMQAEPVIVARLQRIVDGRRVRIGRRPSSAVES